MVLSGMHQRSAPCSSWRPLRQGAKGRFESFWSALRSRAGTPCHARSQSCLWPNWYWMLMHFAAATGSRIQTALNCFFVGRPERVVVIFARAMSVSRNSSNAAVQRSSIGVVLVVAGPSLEAAHAKTEKHTNKKWPDVYWKKDIRSFLTWFGYLSKLMRECSSEARKY